MRYPRMKATLCGRQGPQVGMEVHWCSGCIKACMLALDCMIGRLEGHWLQDLQRIRTIDPSEGFIDSLILKVIWN